MPTTEPRPILLKIDMTGAVNMTPEEINMGVLKRCREAGIPVIGFSRIDGVERGKVTFYQHQDEKTLMVEWNP